MVPTTQAGSSDLSSHHPQHQHQVGPKTSHIGNSAHNLAAVASAAGYTTENHLAGLVEAATAAAGQDVSGWAQNEDGDGITAAAAAAAAAAAGHARGVQGHLDGYNVGVHLEDELGNSAAGAGQSHHFASIAPGADDIGSGTPRETGHGPDTSLDLARRRSSGDGGEGPPLRKRRRMNPQVDPAITGGHPSQFSDADTAHGVSGGAIGEDGRRSGNGNNHELRIQQVDVRQNAPHQAISEGRPAGVHSAVALFRQPSSTSKKHTRPPMSQLFASLELSPENFLHLQAAAKAYMLDEAHPERRDCVGQRGKGDMEMVKLRLWNCVRDFLDKEGNGLRFFGEDVVNEGMGPRTMVWPRDEQKIISLVMPLLRRMVTNERQRQYAIETRKGGSEERKRKQKQQQQQQQRQRQQSAETFSQSTPGQTFHQQPFPSQEFELGMRKLLPEGYATDLDSIMASYNAYNQNYQLDNLGSISGLPQSEWLGLIAAVDSHYQMDHNGDASQCDASCQEYTVNHIVSSDCASNVNWRISGSPEDIAARNYFATGITRDVVRIVRESLLSQAELQQQQQQQPQQQQQQEQQQPQRLPQPQHEHHPHQSAFPSPSTTTDTSYHHTHLQSNASLEQSVITVHINIVQNGQNKRILPRFDLPADQCPDYATLINKIRQYIQHHQIQYVPALRLRALLENGLVPIQNDGEWMVALLAVTTAEWMDGELRIVVENAEGDPA
ncbi:hypothetical protein VTO42DRAFT_5247 [Malbranchea cinnamomea]